MEEDPGSDAWTTVDRKTAKKKGKDAKPEPDGTGGGWNQVTKDRRRKESGRPDQADRRGGDRRSDRGKPPPRGGSAQRNTLPRKPSQRDGGAGWSSNRSSPSPAPTRNRQNPTSDNRNRQVPESNPVKQETANAPRKSSWACLVGNKGTEGRDNSASSEGDSITENKLSRDAVINENPATCCETVADIGNQGLLSNVDNDASLSKSSGCNEQSLPSIHNLNQVPSNDLSSVESKPVENEPLSEDLEIIETPKEEEGEAVSSPTSQGKNNEATSPVISPLVESPPVKPDGVSSPGQDNEGIVMSLDKIGHPETESATLDKIGHPETESATDVSKLSSPEQNLDSNGNKVQLDKNKNETPTNKAEISMEEIVGKINPETRHYDRDVLLQLQKHPLSLQKPDKLPELEIVLSCPMRSSTSAPTLGEMPSQYVHTYGGGRMGMPTKRDSRRKESKKIISLSREPVKLHKAENAWMPGSKTNEEKASEREVLSKKVRAILNKLTPQKFDTLVVQFKELAIDTEDKLVQCMELVFEKALDESAFSEAYAKMCNELSLKRVPVAGQDNPVDFKGLLLKRCQVEFEKDYMSDEQRKKYDEDFAAAVSEDDKKRIKDEFELLESKLRRRSLGNIKFIGELFKLQLLKGRIMHSIIQRLLTSTDEESLECLCRLLYTCGGLLEAQVSTIPEEFRKNFSFDKYFAKIQEIVDSKKTSSRVRFLLQDVIDLRINNWVSRRVEAGPKKIEQIHKEAKLEALKIQLADQKPDPPVGRRSEERSRRKTEFRPKTMNHETTWNNVPNKAAKISDVVDPERLRMIKKVDADSLMLGPSFGRGFSSAGFGSSMAKPAETVRSVNRFQMFEDSDVAESSLPAYSGRASEPVRNTYDLGARRTSPSLPSSRDISTTKQRSPLRGKPDTDEDQLHTKSITLIKEYISNCDFVETLSSVCELYHSKNIEILVEETFNLGMEMKMKRDRERCGEMMSRLLDNDVITWSNLTGGLGVLLDIASDIIVDVPKFWDLSADILAVVLVKQDRLGSVVDACCSFLENDNQRRNLILSLLREVKSVDAEKFTKFMSDDKEILEKSLSQNLQEFLFEEHLSEEKPGEEANKEILVNGSLQEDLFKKLAAVFRAQHARNDEMSSVDAIISDKVMDKETVRTLVTAVIESAIDGIGGPSVSCALNENILEGRIPILKKYLDANKDREVYALYAIQNLVNRLEHPNKLLHSILELLYDKECISEEGLFDWEKSEDPEEQEGKGVALKSCNQLFQWLRTAEEEEDQAV